MKTFLTIIITALLTWLTFSIVRGLGTGRDRLWMISAMKAPGRMALTEIQADMDAGRYALAKAKIDILKDTWQKFESGPDSCTGPDIGNIMLEFSKLETNRNPVLQKK